MTLSMTLRITVPLANFFSAAPWGIGAMATIRNLLNLNLAELLALVDEEQSAERFEPARMLCLVGLTHFPHSADLLTRLGWNQTLSGDLFDAEASFRHSLCYDEANAGTHAGLAAALALSGNCQEAVSHYQRAVERDPGDAQTIFNFGCSQMSLRQMDDAIRLFEQAIHIDPDLTDAHHNLGVALNKVGRWKEAIESCELGLARRPDSWPIRLVRAAARLALGSFAAGWADYEARIESPDYCTRLLGLPAWGGLGDRRKSIAIVPEQGVGTMIMFASCLEDLAADIPRCTLGCEPRLISLFRRSFPSLEIVADGLLPLLARNGEFDCYAMIGSLPGVYRTTRESFRGSQYLTADPFTSARWAKRLAKLGRGPKIGVSWRGGSFRADSLHRCTELADLVAPLANAQRALGQPAIRCSVRRIGRLARGK